LQYINDIHNTKSAITKTQRSFVNICLVYFLTYQQFNFQFYSNSTNWPIFISNNCLTANYQSTKVSYITYISTFLIANM